MSNLKSPTFGSGQAKFTSEFMNAPTDSDTFVITTTTGNNNMIKNDLHAHMNNEFEEKISSIRETVNIGKYTFSKPSKDVAKMENCLLDLIDYLVELRNDKEVKSKALSPDALPQLLQDKYKKEISETERAIALVHTLC